jgi:hypothetical protein
MSTLGTRWVTLRSIFAFTALLAVASVHAQTGVTIRAANSVNKQILGVTFAPNSATVLNTDQATLGKLNALALVTNPNSFGIDLFVADNQNHHIWSYAGDFCPASPPPPAPPVTPACTKTGTIFTQAAAINYPDGTSLDSGGSLFAVDNAPGKSPLAQVWVMQLLNGVYQNAVQIDTTAPGGSLGAAQAVVETMIVNAPLGAPNCGQPQQPACLANVGDLLVVSNNPDKILLYPGNGSTGPTAANHSPGTLIRQCTKPKGDSNCIPGGSAPQGVAVWPADNSVLITVNGGMILRFSLANGVVTQMATVGGLPGGLVKIKTGFLQKSGAVGFVAQSAMGNHGSILKLTPVPNSNNIQVSGSVSSGVAAPDGLAVTTGVSAPASTCQPTLQNPNAGCDLLGDPANNVTVLKHVVQNAAALAGNIVEDVCIVQADPRPQNTASGACNDAPLPVNQVCPGFDNTGHSLFIPGYLCGGSAGTGQSIGTGFALIRTLTTHAQASVSEWNGTYVESSADSTKLLPGNNLGANNPFCGPPSPPLGIGTLVWAPLKNEGTIDEDFNGFQMVDITDGCGTGHGGSGYASLWAIGLALDPTAHELQPGVGGNSNTSTPLGNFAQGKYTHLTNTITAFSTGGNITSPPNVSQELFNNNSNNSPGCIDVSQAYFANATTNADLQNAANLLTDDDQVYNTSCDYIVTSHIANFVESTSPVVLNPSGQIRSRLANLYYTINTDILGNPAPSAWPPAVSVSASVSPQAVANTGAATVVWGVNDGNAPSCTISTDDPNYSGPLAVSTTTSTPLGPWPLAPTAGATYTYTLTCPVPSNTVKPPATTMSVAAHLTVWPVITGLSPQVPLTTSPNPTSISGNGGITSVTWTPPAGATQCTLTSTNGQGTANPLDTVTPATGASRTATYTAVAADVSTGTVNFAATCTAGASPGSGQVTVVN